jgi:hypothetical protein
MTARNSIDRAVEIAESAAFESAFEPRSPPLVEREYSAENDALFGLRERVRTQYSPQPIPTRHFDWAAWLDGREEDGPFGNGATEADAIEELRVQLQMEGS